MPWIIAGGTVLGALAASQGGDDAEPAVTGFAALPPQMQQALLSGTAGATDLFNQGPDQFFGGQTFADLTPEQLAGLESQLGFAGTLDPTIQNIMGSFNQGINPDTVNNPAVQAMLGSIESRGNSNLLENILPGIRRRAGVTGGEFGSRQDLTSGVAIGDAVGEIADAQGTFLGNQLNSARALQGSLLGQSNSILQSGLVPGQIQQQVGGVFQGQDQQAINEAIARFDFNQQAPQQNLADFIANMQGLSGAGGTASTSPGVNTGVSTISGALAGASAGSAVASAFPNLFSRPQAATPTLNVTPEMTTNPFANSLTSGSILNTGS